ELRTPVAVMSGALDILESRNQLNINDQATLLRVRRACDEMRDNIDILLKLSRNKQASQVHEIFDIKTVAQQVIDDLKISHAAGQRITLIEQTSFTASTDPIMVRLLLRNLMQNALQH